MVFAVLGMLGLSSPPATALSCAEPAPIDWSVRLPATSAAVVGIVEKVELVEGDEYASNLALRVRVTEYLHGRAPATIEYTTPNFDPWGPYYEVGREIAIVIEDGEVTDGQMQICGPWFGPEELRQAAADHGTGVDVQPLSFHRLLGLLERLFEILFHWSR